MLKLLACSSDRALWQEEDKIWGIKEPYASEDKFASSEAQVQRAIKMKWKTQFSKQNFNSLSELLEFIQKQRL